MANTFLGVGITFGTSGTAVTGSGIGTFKLQSYDHSKSREKDLVKDEAGTDVQCTLFNPTEEATFEYFPSGSTSALATTATVIPDAGAIVTVANSTSYTPIAATTWFVYNDPVIRFTNTGAARVTLHLKRWTGTSAITAVTT